MTASKVKHIRDSDPAVEFRAPTAAAITATGATGELSLNKLTAAYWQNGELPWSTIAVQVVVTELDRTTGDETYTLNVQADVTGFATPVVVASATVSEVGAYVLAFDADTVAKLEPTGTHLRINAVLAGTTPILKYHAWLVHLPEAS